MTLNVLVGCEESGIVRDAFAALGHNAWSCDLKPSRRPGNHYQCDIFEVLCKGWDIIILHPPCTHTALCGNKHYWNSPLRTEGALFTQKLWNEARKVCRHVALEQPRTIVQRYIGKRSQVIQPYQFGHGETKETWLWLHGLPLLVPTSEVEGREHRIWKMAPGENRQRDRSTTYPGIANAFACQWSAYLLEK